MKDTLITSSKAQPSPRPPVTNNDSPSDRAAINRSNSQHSTGPRTDAGKKRSSLNALRHGLTGHTIVMPEEDLIAYQRQTQRFFDDLKPKGALEEQLVQTIADTAWRLNRIPVLEANILTAGMNAYSESVENNRNLSLLSIHEHRLTRKFDITLKQLTTLQANRCAREESEMAKAADLLEMHRDKDLPYYPAADGFVLTNDEIATHLQRKNRLKEASDAAVRRYLASK